MFFKGLRKINSAKLYSALFYVLSPEKHNIIPSLNAYQC